jgi:hypothetical protein
MSSRTGRRGSGVFKVRIRGREVFNSDIVSAGDPPIKFSVPLNGERIIDLDVDVGGDSIDFAHANWANLTLE